MMAGQLWLGIVIIALVATIANTASLNDLNSDKINSNKFNEKNDINLDKKKVNTLPPVIKEVLTTKSPVSTIGIESFENDLEKFEKDASHSEIGKKDDDYDDEYSDDDYYADNDNSTEFTIIRNKTIINDGILIPIKMNDKVISSTLPSTNVKGANNNTVDDSDDYDSEEYDDEEDEEEDDTLSEDDDDDESYDDSEDDIDNSKSNYKNNIIENNISYDDDDDKLSQIVHSQTICPRDCVCERNLNNYMVATCRRLDKDIQKFDSTITDLQIVDIGPKYPIVLDDGFFRKIGLIGVESIKISNCTIETISKSAFSGLDKLYSLNLSNTGIELIHPNTFESNLRLKILTLSGNDLSNMQHKISQYSNYMLKAPSVEELDLSNCNLNELLPTAFDELKNVVFINLANNKLKTLPATLFNKVETIEELDLGFNAIENLPKGIFNRTVLAILNLQYNEISKSIDFVTSDLQRLNLGYCKIKNINSQMFKGMDSINHLSLKGNGIKKIHPIAFAALKNLRNIDLSFNDLDQISALIFAENRNLDVIKLNDNRRLKKLPMEGFETAHASFNVYYLDISNCDITYLGENTFSTMPHLTILHLGYNKIANMGKGIFSYLSRLIDLDLSNNYIADINEFTFFHNKNLKKLKLNGNPIRHMSTKAFATTNNLAELDVSECDLTQMWKESSPQNHPNKVLRKLKYLNISYNEIDTIYQSDLEIMTNLNVLDITNNPLKCDTYFEKLLKWLGKKHIKASDPLKGRPLSSLEVSTFFVKDGNTWDDLAQIVCKLEGHDKTTVDNVDDDEDLFEDETDEDEDDSLDSSESAENIENGKDEIKDGSLTISEVDMIQNFEDKVLKGTYRFDDDDEDVLILENNREYRAHFVWPILIVVTSVILLLVVIAKIVLLVIQRRGERYRQALLASKNSIIYQKLSEEVAPQTPKVHRYQPIEQV